MGVSRDPRPQKGSVGVMEPELPDGVNVNLEPVKKKSVKNKSGIVSPMTIGAKKTVKSIMICST